MTNPQRRMNVVSEAVGDGLAVFDAQLQKSYVLNATSALVFQHCDGQTTPQQLVEHLRRKINVSHAQAEDLLWLALDELEKAQLLQTKVAATPAPRRMLSRRQALTAFATAGLSIALMPVVSPVTVRAAGDHNLIPLLECVVNNGNGTFTARFGYLNQTDDVINVPIGAKNQFVKGGPANMGQPTVFLPGEHINVFQVTFNADDELKWMLKADGDRRHQVEASADSEICVAPTTTTTASPPTTTASPPTTTAPPTTTTPSPPTTTAAPPTTTPTPPTTTPTPPTTTPTPPTTTPTPATTTPTPPPPTTTPTPPPPTTTPVPPG